MQEAGLQAPTIKVNAGFVTLSFVLPAGATPITPGKTPGKTPDLIRSRLAEAPGASIPNWPSS
jgi:hypothetical protein